MKNYLILILFITQINIVPAQIDKIYSSLSENKKVELKSNAKGCLSLTMKEMNQSYSTNCEKPINFTINSLKLNDDRIDVSLTMHYFGNTKLVGFIEIKDNLLILSYGESSSSQQQVDKYILN
tara:strand:- start:51 stop:419 length:369 start_codon:yes stop_codon:yes gene_type:complete